MFTQLRCATRTVLLRSFILPSVLVEVEEHVHRRSVQLGRRLAHGARQHADRVRNVGTCLSRAVHERADEALVLLEKPQKTILQEALQQKVYTLLKDAFRLVFIASLSSAFTVSCRLIG